MQALNCSATHRGPCSPDLATSDYHLFPKLKEFTKGRKFADDDDVYVINIWNGLPVTVNFSTLKSFRRTIQSVDFSSFLKCS